MINFLKDAIKSSTKEILQIIIVTLVGYFLGNYFETITLKRILLILIIGFVIALIISIINKFINTERENSIKQPRGMMILNKNTAILGTFNYEGLRWEITYTMPHYTHFVNNGGKLNLNTKKIEVNTEVYCPECKTGLIEEKGIISRFKWICPNCKYKNRKQENYEKLRIKAEKVARNLPEFKNKYINSYGELDDPK